MQQLVAVGKVEHGGPVVIVATTLPAATKSHEQLMKDDPEYRGRFLFLRALQMEHCPPEWGDL